MTERPQIFAQEWRRCLAAHYQTAVRLQDVQQIDNLARLLSQLNFPEQQLAGLQAAAEPFHQPVEEQPIQKTSKKNVPSTESQWPQSDEEKQHAMGAAEWKPERECASEKWDDDTPSMDLMDQDHEQTVPSAIEESPAVDPQLSLFESADL